VDLNEILLPAGAAERGEANPSVVQLQASLEGKRLWEADMPSHKLAKEAIKHIKDDRQVQGRT
jgi:hypothetical protein